MAKREVKNCCVVEFPLWVTPKQEQYLKQCLRAEHSLLIQLYRIMVSRKKLMRETIACQQVNAKFKRIKKLEKMSKRDKTLIPIIKQLKEECKQEYQMLDERFAFYHPEKGSIAYRFGSDMDICGLGTIIRNKDKFIHRYINSNIKNAICNKFAAAWKALKGKYTKRGKPAEMWFPKFPNSIPQHVTDTVFVVDKNEHFRSYAKFQGVKLKVWLKDKVFDFKQQLVLNKNTRGFSLVRKFVNGTCKWYAVVMVESAPNMQVVPQEGILGVDIGTQHIAVVDGNSYEEIDLYNKVLRNRLNKLEKLKRRIGRSRDRSLRKMNPDAYDEKGRYIKGHKLLKSKRFYELNHKQREVERITTAIRKHFCGEITNKLLLNNTVKMEDINIKEWQEEHGKAVGNFAPGQFKSELERKAKALNINVELINTYKTKLSQYCVCGNHIGKAPLHIRIRTCNKCGRTFDRDLMSAFLVRFVKKVLDKSGVEMYNIEWEQAINEWNKHPISQWVGGTV